MEQAPGGVEPEVIADPRGTAVNSHSSSPARDPRGGTEPNRHSCWRTFNAEGWAIARTTENTGFTCAQCGAAVDSLSGGYRNRPRTAFGRCTSTSGQATALRVPRSGRGHRRRLPRSEAVVVHRCSRVWCGTAEQGGPRRHRCADRAHAGGARDALRNLAAFSSWSARSALSTATARSPVRPGRGAEVGVRDRVSPCRSPGDGDLTHDTVLADRHFRVEQRSQVLRLVVGNMPHGSTRMCCPSLKPVSLAIAPAGTVPR